METLNICRVCLRTDGKLHNFETQIKQYYNELCGLSVEHHTSALKICPQCAHLLQKFSTFQKKCKTSYEILQNWLNIGQKITKAKLSQIRNDLKPSNLCSWDERRYKVITYQHVPNKKKHNLKNTNLFHICHVELPNENTMLPEDSIGDSKIFLDNENENKIIDIKEYNEINTEMIFMENTNKDDTEDYIKKEDIQEDITMLIEGNAEDNSDLPVDTEQTDTHTTLKDLSVSELSTRERKKLLREIKGKKQDLTQKEKQLIQKLDKRHKPLQELEEDFNIELFFTENEQREDFERRRSSKSYTEASVKCEKCLMGFREQKLLDIHNKKHEPSAGEHICNICQIRCPTSKLYRNHRDTNHTTKYTCKRCPYITYSKQQARKHHGWHEGVEHICQHCGTSFRKHTTYMSHLRLVHPSTHICSACARTFVSPYGLHLHRKAVHKGVTASEKDSARCEECNVTFDTHKVYTRHLLITPKHKELARDILGCKKCGELFDTREKFEEHTHKKEKKKELKRQYTKCTECEEQFSHPTGMYQHFLKAHPDKPYKLARQRNYLCEQCGKTFSCQSAHALAHSGNPTMRQCSGPLLDTGKHRSHRHLSSQQRIHAGKCYSCDYCKRAFADTSNLRQHIKRVHYNKHKR